MSKVSQLKSNSSDNIDSEFRKTLKKISELYPKFGVENITSFTDENLPDFSKLNEEDKRNALRKAKSHLEILEECIDIGLRKKEDMRNLWVALKCLKMVAKSDLLSYVEAQDIIEIYSLDNKQLWHNFNCMEVCNYTLEEVFCYTWEERYTRDDSKLPIVIEKVGALLAEPKVAVHKLDVSNIVEEKFSANRFTLDCLHTYGANLFNKDNGLVGYLIISKAKILKESENPNYRNKPRLVTD